MRYCHKLRVRWAIGSRIQYALSAMMARFGSLLMLSVVSVCIALGSTSCFSRRESPEVLLFARISTKVASRGYVSTLSPTGGRVEDILASGRGRLYESVSANSLAGLSVMLVRDSGSSGIRTPQLYEGRLSSDASWHVVPNIVGLQGPGFISSDTSQLLFSMAKQSQPALYSLWVTNFSDGKPRQVTNPDNSSWDTSPCWRPDGKELLFTRVRRDQGSRLHASLMRVDLQTTVTSVIFSEDAAVGYGAYSPDGMEIAIWSSRGLEILNVSSSQRTIVEPLSNMPGRQYYGGGITWSRDGNTLALPLLNPQTNTYELMTISRHGGHMNTIYSSSEFRILTVSFVRRN
jgi:hypothetical protein